MQPGLSNSHWVGESGDVQKVEGSWIVTSAGKDTTLLVYTSHIEIKRYPKWVVVNALKSRQPKVMLENLLRIGRRAIVSFPNFGFWKMRLQLLVGGHMPRTENLPATWYDTANIHFCTIKDFVELCDAINVKMERSVALDLYGRPVPLNLPWWVWNMFGEQGVFLLSRGK